MHMADALISPAVGSAMWVVTAGLISYSAKKVKKEIDDKKIPLMGVMGAFIFAVQMINFSIPATGSSGHLGGAMILAILLGPYTAFLTMASILTIQALFFADGGLLALGCNIFNLGFFPCFIAYPLLYKKIVGDQITKQRIAIGASLAAVIGLQLGAFGVVVETFLSGISELPFTTFLIVMQSIHLAIGLVEGLVTTAVILFIFKERAEIIQGFPSGKTLGNLSLKPILTIMLVVALVTGGMLSWFASGDPDGLEWSVTKVTGLEELEAPEGIYGVLADLQNKVAIFPDYNFRDTNQAAGEPSSGQEAPAWAAVDSGLSTAGVVGSILTLVVAGGIGKLLQIVHRRHKKFAH
ncbi:Cobalt transport protein CbiM [bioreactor metagenome]|uniref:Cobalt transport protein CbiM n=1 Tax=bioreactor metagenome TaxID=1076179 RepID=A0A644U7T6_9ZZZZ|nr:energy-coupling factor ABC transporter permease [Negativicutes bacterium]